MSSLASQLQNIASLDASRLTSKTGAPSGKSYLFPPKTAASHDIDAIFSLAQSGFEELLQLDPEFEEFEDSLFSEHARRTDRTLLNEAENKELDVVLGRCLRRLGRWIGIMAGGKCIEWLVRRFRVHEMNAEAVLQVFLPYHQSPNFPRMLSILTIPKTSRYSAPFEPLIKNPQPLPRSYITQAVSPSRDKTLRLLMDVAGMVQVALNDNTVHRGLLTFWSATMVELIESERAGKGVGEGLVKVLVEAFVSILETPKGGQDVNAAVYPPLILLARSVRLADGPFQAIASALLTPSSKAEPTQRILTLLFMLNERPDWEEGLGEKACARLCKIKGLSNILIGAMEKYGFSQAMPIVVKALLEDVSTSKAVLYALVTYRGVQPELIDSIASRLLDIGSDPSSFEQDIEASKELLTTLVERYPSHVDRARSARIAAGQQVMDTLVDEDKASMAFVNAYSADAAARIRSIQPLLRAIGVMTSEDSDISMEDNVEDRDAAIEKIQLLLGDDDHTVIQALYNDLGSNASRFFEVFTSAKYVAAITPQFDIVKPVLAVRSQHTRFIAEHLDIASLTQDESVEVFMSIIFPSLLATSSRPCLSRVEWTALDTEGFFGKHELTSSTAFKTAVPQAKSADAGSKEQGISLNLVLANAVAASLATPKTLSHYQTALVSRLQSQVPTTRLMAHLVLGRLLESLSGSEAADLGVAILAALEASLTKTIPNEVENPEEPLNPIYLQAIYTKSENPMTLTRATASLMASFTKLARSDFTVNWFAKSVHRTLATTLYRHANSIVLPAALAKNLLRSLFASLREDALVFFASVWTDVDQKMALRVAALRHATAFVKAYALGTDFQMVLPSILVAFTSTNGAVREAAVALLKVVNRSASNETKNYYAIDTFYGESTTKVQLLKHGDLIRYLQAIIPALEEIQVDATRLAAVHSSELAMNHGRGRKETGHRRSVIGSFLSHISAIPSLATRIALLQTLAGVHDASILRGTLPLLTPLLDAQSSESQWVASLSKQEVEAYLKLVFGAFSTQSASLLTDKECEAGAFVRDLLKGTTQSSAAPRLRELLLERFASGVFGALSSEAKVAYFGQVVKGLHNLDDGAQIATVKASLKRFDLDVTSLILVIDDLSKPLHETTAQPKKQKQDGTVAATKHEQAVADLTVLLESRDWNETSGDAPLVAALMSVLSALLAKRQHIKEGVDYLEQEILGAILALVEKIQQPEEIQKAHIGVEVIIKVIRASTNPRTSQRALLVASELARLIPDAVLHNIMPIFTFMSASDLQRDDAYSFGVVEKTVSRIVPVMTRSLRDKAQNKLELYNESLTFISIFTDMAGRLPRHRTMPFFRHLTHSLGPSDFLAPVCMLLIDRTVTKAGRSAGLTLDLPLGVVGSYDVSIRMDVVLEIVQELARLVQDTTSTEKTAFLSSLLGDQVDLDRTVRQIQVLLRFVNAVTAQLVGRPCDQGQAEVLVQQLILLGSAVKSASLHQTEVGQLVYSATGGAMQLLSAENFLSIIARLLASEGAQDIKVALEIFVDRLPLIKTPVRSKCAASMGSIVEKSAGLLSTQAGLVPDALAALRAVAATAVPSEDMPLSKAVPKIVEVVKAASSNGTTIAAMSLLELSARHLSSRLIPHAQMLITILLAVAQSAGAAASQAFLTISAVIEAIPTFVSSKQLISILQTSIEQRTESDVSSKLLTVSAKKVPTKTLFPVVMDLWKDIQNGDASAMEGFFHLLRMTLRHADRQNLPAMVKQIFAFFLDVFDLRHRLQKRDFDQVVINEIEESAIVSFLELVIRLNEVTFKPLFIRLYDWAVIDLSEGANVDNARLVERKLVLLHVMMGLLQKFRHLLSPYIGILLPHIEELLPAYASGSIQDEALWTLLLEVLAKSYEVDDGAFWTDQHHIKMIPLLTAQLPLFPNSPSTPVATAFSALAGSTTSTQVLKALNTSLCLATRSDSAPVRMSALKCIDGVWEKQPDEMIQFVPETVSEFLSELLEDENSDVENMARKVLARIEGLTGSLKEYLE